MTALILCYPDHTKPFVVEVDTSNLGVGTILSQHFGEKPKSHPVAFFTKKISPVDKITTSAIGNCCHSSLYWRNDNTKDDSLSCMHSMEYSRSSPESILITVLLH